MVFASAQMVMILCLITVIIGLLLGEHYREIIGDHLPWIIGLIAVTAAVVAIKKYFQNDKTNRFSNVRDLITGVVETDLGDVKAMYQHFRQLPEIKVVNVKENFDCMDKVEVYFLYNECITGRIEFRCL